MMNYRFFTSAMTMILALSMATVYGQGDINPKSSEALQGMVRGLSGSGAITGFELYDAATDEYIQDIENGDTIYAYSPPDYNIKAVIDGTVHSVVFWYNDRKFHTEYASPYAFCGDKDGDYYSCRALGCGYHKVKAVPYSGRNAPYDDGSFEIYFHIECKQVVSRFELYDADTNTKIVDLYDGDTIAGSATTTYNVRAITDGPVESVKLWYDSYYRTENSDPYYLCGDYEGDVLPCDKLGCGTHTVYAVPYSGDDAGGIEGYEEDVYFTIDCAP